MTAEILQSDITLARKMIGSGCPDEEIVHALAYRKIAHQRAQGLVQALRAGQEVLPDAERLPSRTPPGGALAPKTSAAANKPVRSTASSNSPAKSTRPGRAYTDAPRTAHWILILGCVVVLLGLAAIAWMNHRRSASSKPKHGEKPILVAPAEPAHFRIEISANNGARFEDRPLHSENVFALLASLCGPPTRTNRITNLNLLVYAFDEYGILLYPEKDAGKDSIVIDFEGTGGTNSAASAFRGTLKVGDALITAQTGPDALRSLKAEGLREQTPDSGIFSLKYNRFTLIFAYLTRPDKLSLVEIDFN